MDGPTDGPMNRQMDKAFHRDAGMHRKSRYDPSRFGSVLTGYISEVIPLGALRSHFSLVIAEEDKMESGDEREE